MTKTISSRNGLSPQPQVRSGLISAQTESDERKLNTDNSSLTLAQSKVGLSLDRWQIVHASNGRIRIRAQESGAESQIEAICQFLRQYPGIKEVTANQQTGSLAIAFAPEQLSLPQIVAKLQELGIQQISADESKIPGDLFAPWKSVDFWKEQTISLIPLMTGLAVTRGLGIAGLASIPVYMIAANTARYVIGSLKSEIPESPDSSKPTEISPSSDKITYSVIHAIPGRIRFNLPRIAEDRAYGRRLERLLKTDGQVTSVRLNYSAASVAIAYQPREVNLDYWVNLMELALQTHPPTKPVQTIEQPTLCEEVSQQIEVVEDQSPEISSPWANMKHSAMSYSLAFMANFPLDTLAE
jgi:hypothetical protein